MKIFLLFILCLQVYQRFGGMEYVHASDEIPTFPFNSNDEFEASLQPGGKIESFLQEELRKKFPPAKKQDCSQTSKWKNGLDTTLQYKKFKCMQNYTMAKKYCEDAGGRLALLGIRNDTARENIFEESFQKDFRKKVWIGLEKVNGTWTWSDDTTTEDNEPVWGVGQPENKSENCALLKKQGPNRTIHDYHCCNEYMFLCERNAD